MLNLAKNIYVIVLLNLYNGLYLFMCQIYFLTNVLHILQYWDTLYHKTKELLNTIKIILVLLTIWKQFLVLFQYIVNYFFLKLFLLSKYAEYPKLCEIVLKFVKI